MLSFISTHDTLTGLYNRAYLTEQMGQIQRQGISPVMVVAGDIDHLKKVNDESGHEAGDRLIQRAAQVLQSVFRKQDIIARTGGDEFIVLLPNANPGLIDVIQKRIETALSADWDAHPQDRLSLSVGIAICNQGEFLQEAVQQADQAMYEMKSEHHKSPI
jgi:diguanylate cyclase (GGDEF)-like protein